MLYLQYLIRSICFDRDELDKVLANGDHKRGRGRPSKKEYRYCRGKGDMLNLPWHTGMRPYEICEMRPFDILTDDPECWIYIPRRDKTPKVAKALAKYNKKAS